MERTFALRIDEEACWGCRTCEVACRQEREWPPGARRIAVVEDGPCWREGKPHFLYRVRVCRQCSEPDCVGACAEGALVQGDEGIVLIVADRCTGCGACVEACPYGAMDLDEEAGTAFKCDLCRERLSHGLLPACVDNVCPGHCIHLVTALAG